MGPIRELMRHDVPRVSPEASVRQVVEDMVDAEAEGVLVVDGRGRVVGSIGDEQLVAALHAKRQYPWWRQLLMGDQDIRTDRRVLDLMAADVMLTRVVAVDPGTPVITALRLFDEYGVNVLPVVGDGRLVGAVFREDLVKWLIVPHSFRRAGERST
jgi:CBS domain-containing protein